MNRYETNRTDYDNGVAANLAQMLVSLGGEHMHSHDTLDRNANREFWARLLEQVSLEVDHALELEQRLAAEEKMAWEKSQEEITARRRAGLPPRGWMIHQHESMVVINPSLMKREQLRGCKGHETFAIYVPLYGGTVCTACNAGWPSRNDCNNCYGTGWVGGWQYHRNVMAVETEHGTDHSLTFRCHSSDRLACGDVLIANEERWVVVGVTPYVCPEFKGWSVFCTEVPQSSPMSRFETHRHDTINTPIGGEPVPLVATSETV